MAAKPILLLTRPTVAARRFIQELPNRVLSGVEICQSPLIEIVPVPHKAALDAARGVVFTSANGVAFSARFDSAMGQSAYCVGKATAQAAQEAGWTAHHKGNTADELVQALIEAKTSGPLLHLRGVHTRGDVAERLSRAGIKTESVVVYDQQLQPLTEQAKFCLNQKLPVLAPIFSPRSARQFANTAPNLANTHVIALSEMVAEPLKTCE